MTRARTLAAGGALLCCVAALFAATALYVPGIAMILAASAATAWVWAAAARASVMLAPVATTAYEGERVGVTVGVARALLPLPGASLSLEGGRVPLPCVRRSAHVATTVLVVRRGRQLLGPALLRIEDPSDLCARAALGYVRPARASARVSRRRARAHAPSPPLRARCAERSSAAARRAAPARGDRARRASTGRPSHAPASLCRARSLPRRSLCVVVLDARHPSPATRSTAPCARRGRCASTSRNAARASC